MDPNNEIAQYNEEQALDSCIRAGDCGQGGYLFDWVIVAALVVVLLIGGRTVRLIILGMLAVPVIGISLVLGVPFLIKHIFGEALSDWQRACVSIGAIAGIIWLAFRWIDRLDRLDRHRVREGEDPPK